MSTDALSGVIRIVIPADTSISPNVIEAENISVPSFIRRASVTISAIFLIPPVSSSAKVFCAVLTKSLSLPQTASFFFHETFPPYTICCHFHFQHYSPALRSSIIPILPYYALFAKILRLQISYILQHALLLTGFF